MSGVRARFAMFAELSRPSNCLLPEQRQRAIRITILLAAVTVLNAFDLGLTHTEMQRGGFVEANVVAAVAVAHGAWTAATYKLLMFGAGVSILFRFRHHQAAETAAWALLTCHVALMIYWGIYLQTMQVCIDNPFASELAVALSP
jgi:hypothetical protein